MDNVTKFNFKKGKAEGAYVILDSDRTLKYNKVFYSKEDCKKFILRTIDKKTNERVYVNREFDLMDSGNNYFTVSYSNNTVYTLIDNDNKVLDLFMISELDDGESDSIYSSLDSIIKELENEN